MSDISNPHDKFFKETFSRLNIARDFFAHHLPKPVVQTLDLSTLALQSGSFVDHDLQEQFADLLYQVTLADASHETAYIYLLLEHKSYADPQTPFQVLRYLVRIWERDVREQKPLRPIVPVVVYHGRGQWRIPTNFGKTFSGHESLRPYWPQFNYELRDLSHLNDEEIVGAFDLQIALLTLKYITTPELREHLPDILHMFRELADAESAVEYMETVLYYIGNAARHLTEPEIFTIVQESLANEGNEIMQTLAEVWLERGREEGLEQGLEQGLQEGRMRTLQDAVLDLVTIRFGPVAEEVEMKIRDVEDNATLQQLHRLAATAVSLDTFLNKINNGAT